MRGFATLFVFFVGVVVPGQALAGPVERLAQVLIHPNNPETIVVRYDNGGGGLVVSRDGGATFQMLCGAATQVGRNRIGAAALTGDGEIMLGTFSGLVRDDGSACGFQVEPTLSGSWVTDLAVDPRDPQTTYAVTGKPSPQQNGLFRRESGAAFTSLGTTSPRLLTRLRVAPLADGGLRFYVSAVDGASEAVISDGGVPLTSYLLRSSDDGGQTWTEHALPPTEGSMRLEAVDPTDPDRIVMSLIRIDAEDSVLVSDDAGQTFREYARVGALAAVLVSHDGRVFIADAGEVTVPDAIAGLWSAPSLSDAPVLNEAAGSLLCLGERASGELLACKSFTFGVLDPDSGAVTPLLDFRAVEEFVQCEGVNMAATCEAQLRPAYCDISHFACAPLCAAYPPTNAVVASTLAENCEGRVDSGQTTPTADAGAAGDDAAGPGAEPPDAGDDAPSGDPGAADVPPPGACSVVVPASRRGAAHAWFGVAGAVLAGAFTRRWRRVRAAS